jgi:hypothetical protein
MHTASLRARWLSAFAVVACAVLLIPATSNAVPPGNNGTVKIDGVPFDSAPDNEPHPGCIFQVDFYGYDLGANLEAEVTFSAQPPSGKKYITLLTDDHIFIGEDSNAGGGSEAGLDATRTYDLSSVLTALFQHPNQGYHVKLTVHADGSAGADTKYKVFWIPSCGTTS